MVHDSRIPRTFPAGMLTCMRLSGGDFRNRRWSGRTACRTPDRFRGAGHVHGGPTIGQAGSSTGAPAPIGSMSPSFTLLFVHGNGFSFHEVGHPAHGTEQRGWVARVDVRTRIAPAARLVHAS